MPETDLKMPMALACKLGSIVVHVDEARSPGGHQFDLNALDALLKDPEVKQWIDSMGAMLPLKRKPEPVLKIKPMKGALRS